MQGKIKIVKDGPYLVSGDLPLDKEIIVRDDAGFSVGYEKGERFETAEEYSLCRCGKSKNQPFCDESHVSSRFDGRETASKEEYIEGADEIHGPELDLTDRQEFCASAGFCRNQRGDVWSLTRQSDVREARDLAIKEACNCPSGRLVAWDKETGKPVEPKFPQSLSLIEDPGKGVSGPLWAKGNIEIESADGTLYEKRNRVTLCRCGNSNNKPFCDGSHVAAGFSDEDSSLLEKRQIGFV